MRLKKLELFGFKSFADKTEVIFDQGVTCIVGPNGCGKSNISDSIRWVLGERSAKMLRGSKMEDVIFNGTDFRKPIAMAEVSLTIDNEDRGLPIDYNEVTITRRLYRSGESEYLLNKTVCRLKDIQDIILDTGIGSNSYSMIEQGRIDYVLNADADERRFLIEEAAGISKYKLKKEEAIRKLERTEDNRLRLNDIIQEVQKNIAYAERQAKRAAKYREELERLKSMEIKKAFYELNALAEKKTELENEIAKIQEELSGLDEKISTGRAEQGRLQDTLKETLLRHSQAEAAGYALQSKMEQNAQQLRFNQEKKLEIASRRGQIDEETRQLEQQAIQTEKEMALKEQEIAGLAAQKQTIETELKTAEQTLRNLEAQGEEMRGVSERMKAQSFEAAASTTRLRNEFHRVAAFLENNTQQKKKQEASAQRVRLENEAWVGKKGDCEKEIASVAAFLEEIAKKASALQLEKTEKQSLHDTSEKELQDTERLMHEKASRFEMLEELELAARADEDSLLAELDENQRQLIRSIRHIFKARDNYEWALEASLEWFSKSLVADSWSTAESMLEKILAKKTSGIGIFIKENAPAARETGERPQHPKIQFALTDAVEIGEEYRGLFQPLLGNILITSSLTPADIRELLPYTTSWKFVSPDGLMLGPDYRMFSRGVFIDEQSTFKRTSELGQLESEIAALASARSRKITEIEELAARLREIEEEQDRTEAEKTNSLVRKESFEAMRLGMEDRLTAFQRELDLFDYETKELESEYEKASREHARLETELFSAEEIEKGIRLQLEMLGKDFERLDEKKSNAMQQLAEVKAQFSSLQEREKLLTGSLEILKAHHASNTKRTEILVQEKQQLETRERAIRQEDENLEAEQTGLAEQRRQADINIEMIRQEKEKQEGELTQVLQAIQQAQGRQQEIRSSLHQFDMQLMDVNYQQKTINERLEQAYKINLAELNREEFMQEGDNPEALAEQIQSLKSKVESLGTVNLLAIEEYEELKTRYDFLMGQQKDLEDAREQLLETIRKINRTTKGLFEETFANVQRTFQEYYQILFRGGSAKLVLVDETNPLESGIDISVRPPGKKPTHISLLSGGEKALTAIALLFALFKIKPSPFCVLDEVDAPLDEANIDRFLTVLKTFLEKSQFIIVTHNRKTIGMGDALYGVTMQEAGVSKLVSVKVNTDSKAAQETHPSVQAEAPKTENSESSEIHA